MRRDVNAISEDANFGQVVDFVAHSRDVHFPVVNGEGILKGLISFEEIRDVLFDEGLRNLVIASDLAHEDVRCLSPQDTLEHAVSQFDKCGSSCLPVVDPRDPRKLIGLLEQRSVLRVYHQRGRVGGPPLAGRC